MTKFANAKNSVLRGHMKLCLAGCDPSWLLFNCLLGGHTKHFSISIWVVRLTWQHQSCCNYLEEKQTQPKTEFRSTLLWSLWQILIGVPACIECWQGHYFHRENNSVNLNSKSSKKMMIMMTMTGWGSSSNTNSSWERQVFYVIDVKLIAVMNDFNKAMFVCTKCIGIEFFKWMIIKELMGKRYSLI